MLHVIDDVIAPFVCVYVHLPVSASVIEGYVSVYVKSFGDALDNNVPIVFLNYDNKYEPIGTLICTVVPFSVRLNIFSTPPVWIR